MNDERPTAEDGAFDASPPPEQPSSELALPRVELMSRAAEGRLFVSLRRRLMAATVRQLAADARLRMGLAILLSVGFWFGVYFLVREGFDFLNAEIGHAATYAETVARVFNLFYASLMVMLVFSSGIILYGSIYRTPEVQFLLTTPVSEGRIFTYKFQEAIFFSSWGFLLLGSPMLVAYGQVAGAPWHFYALMLPFMIAFVFVPSGAGAVACLVIVNYLTKARLQVSAAAVALLAVSAIAALWWLFAAQETELLTPAWFQEVSSRLRYVEYRLLPSWWLSSGMLEASRTEADAPEYSPLAQAILFLMLLISNALLFHQVAVWLARRIYRASYSRLQTARMPRRRRRVSLIDRCIPHLAGFLPRQIQLLIVKDLRIFRRDPMQWTQFLIFFGLLSLYFLNVRGSRTEASYIGWVNIVSFLNLAVVGLILSAFTTRFVFPMISLEGRRFWILGLLPLQRRTLLWGKFVFAAVGSTIPCAILILLSDMMLLTDVERPIRLFIILVHQLTCVLLCLGLSGIAVGLGATMPDLRETSPSKIAAGFGGTLNLIISATYIVCVVGLTAVPCHFYVIAKMTAEGLWDLERLQWLVTGGIVGAVALGGLATWAPMALGFRAFEKMEF